MTVWWTSVKLLLLSLPFMVLGVLFAPFIPPLPFNIAGIVWLVTIVFGFFVMVLDTDDDGAPKMKRFLILLGKIVFLALFIVSISCMIEFKLPTLFMVPASIIGAKIIFRVNITNFLG